MFNLASRARPYLGAVVLTTILLSLGGVYFALRMPSSVYPEVTFPRVQVIARVPGFTTQNMDLQVTRPLEEAVSTVIGVSQVRSKTIRGGSELSIDFNPGTDMNRAEQLVWNRVGAKRSELPPNVDVTVDQMTPSVFPIMSLVLTGGDSPAQLRDYAFYQLTPQIRNIPDVLYANVAGGDLREITVEARPDDLLAAGLSAADLADQIGKRHILEPVGRVERLPYAYQILANSQGTTTRDIEELPIATKNNQSLRVRDVADVSVSSQDRTMSIGYEGRDAVVITIFRRLGGNTVNVSHDVRELLSKQQQPRNIKATFVYDQATFVTTSVHNVRDAILIGGAFSILILLLFLRNWRATLISAVAIPITLAITFLFLYWSGELFKLMSLGNGATLNLMSLGGLAVAVGLIIDDTVVVIENIARHLVRPATSGRAGGVSPLMTRAYQGMTPPYQRMTPAYQGANAPRSPDPVDAASSEITGAVIGSTLTTVLVFLPLAFIAGVYGQFFAALAWSLAIAVLVSMVISLTLVPVFAAKFLAGRPMPEPGPIYRYLADLYEKMLAVALRFPALTLALSVAAVGFGAILYWGIPIPKIFKQPKPGQPAPMLVNGLDTGLMPAMDEGAFVLDYWAPTGTPLERTQEIARDLEQILSKNPDVEAYVRRTGAELGLFATQTSRGDIQVVLRPAENDPISYLRKRVRPPMDEIETELKAVEKERNKEMTADDKKKYIRDKYRRRPMKGTESNKGVMDEIEDEIKENYGEHQLKFELVQIMQDELNDLSGANKPVEVKFFGPEYAILRDLAGKMGEKYENERTAGRARGIKEMNTNVKAGNPDLEVKLDTAQAMKVSERLTQVDLDRQLDAIFHGRVATRVRESALRITDVRVRYKDRYRFGSVGRVGNPSHRFDPESVLHQWILLPEGAPAANLSPAAVTPLAGPARAVPLHALARLEKKRSPDEQWRENQQPAQFVTADLNEAEAGLGSAVSEVQGWMQEMKEKGEVPSGYRMELGGHYVKLQEAKWSFALVLTVAVLLVYIMLAFQFQSVVLPLLIFLTQPLSLVSGLFALWLTGTPLNISSGMGMILLVGLDMKNGIILVEYIQQLRKEGMALRPALLLAGRTRFRPILMTSLAAILGLFPLALGIGPGAQMQQPLAIMVIGGLTANMLFTRVVIPVGYLVLEQFIGQNEADIPEVIPVRQ